jgi:hypothetical protein
MRLLLYACVAILTTGALSYVQRVDPAAIQDLLVKVDMLGFTQAAQQESQRLAKIRALTIPYEKKKALIERTIFMGATKEMVTLALGEPRSMQKNPTNTKGGKKTSERWVFFFKEDARPTILEFEKDTLVSAYKSSNLDAEEQEQQ